MQQEPVIFATPGYYSRELAAEEVPQLQALFDANPEYFLAMNGQPPQGHEAWGEFGDYPPAHLPYAKRWFAGLFDEHGKMVGVVSMVSDFCVAHVWHVALFMIATRFQGQGVARAIYEALEIWMHDSGARWIRLGVVRGNARAERFWTRQGFQEVRARHVAEPDGRTTSVRVMVKPMEPWKPESEIKEYLARVPRDRPESELP
ncbi:acetyltransferase (GNAT) family protein [Roseimicrobium gellanilyticum]|uniref:Acetyltransferase (GNAT) family protein n=1 Tax=Roseimicrobium gellanilyticum TaxID=748857 RepID=A0A366H0Y8_9BACT|nr:GNAT family N-acetyltransferase [Roseimicrobium gellanilyticum]RBP35527.1 acetyltransferase (GNAT) family protein [Roseimicrobium gellanilyticum]